MADAEAERVVRVLDDQADAEWELESEEGSLWTGTRFLIGMVAMAWAAVAFAYFYLKSVDVATAWRPRDVTPPFLLGTLIMLCVVLGAIMLTLGARQLREGLALEWWVGGWMCVGLGLVATGLQVWTLTRMGFPPGESGYTSVFVGFGLLNVGFLFTASLWPEMLVARSHRLRFRTRPKEYFGLSMQPEMRLLRASLRGAVTYWWFVAAVSIFFWFLFYGAYK